MRVNKDLVEISLKQSNINPLVVQSLTTWQANGFIRWWYKQVTTEHCQATPGYSVTSLTVHHEIDRVQHYRTVYRQSDLWSKAGRFIHLRIYTNIKFLKVSGH